MVATTTSITMGRIIFFEEKNFQGRSYECSSDCSDIHLHLSRCSSCRVENGCFVLYDRSNFIGNQVFLRRGEYSDLMRVGSMTGVGAAMMDTVRSCRLIPMHRGQFRVKIYELENFGGQMQELLEDCESLQDRLYMSDCQSCNVLEGHWLLFEQPNFRGRVIYVKPGEHRSLRESSLSSVMKISSIKRIMDVC
ncbi:gamma-crystallin M3-like [Phyllopteryx taeniolatus]|uniref:gamma-crystallin M3-like n=1 Tax=Phycodurus eques TaxID=693459 RepID=UPI002ACD7578|nr:gamma-crystallin M3-like [Phycodurus eques]XP_061644833.1 gamma-crystallin M3-like [Phyllopteryx taeniolatus]